MSSDNAKLVLAASKGNDAKVKRLLKAKVDVDAGVVNGNGVAGITALQEACAHGHEGSAKKPAKRVGLIDMGLLHTFMM
jgi:ankyrin repeat protein